MSNFTTADNELLATIIDLCDALAWDRPADESRLYELTKTDTGPKELVRLAEAFGLMLVKIDARNMHTTKLIEDIIHRNAELEDARHLLTERNNNLMQTVQEAYQASRIVAQCPAMRTMLHLAMALARRPINTLLLGPTGAGKEVIAKFIHYNSPRRQGPFIGVNCTAVPDSLFESVMFGIEKGVATGVVQSKGLVQESHKGTLFLDEIADMPLANQAKLLRVLEEREVTCVGGSKPVSVDINVIAATNVQLEEAVANGTFRQDLYYRINVAEIRIPPLCERGDDILVLARNYLRQHSLHMGRIPLRLTQETERLLQAYAWPGNVRELTNEMERAAALTVGDCVTPADLSPRLLAGLPDSVVSASVSQASVVLPVHHDEHSFNLEEAERTLIAKAIAFAEGNKTRAAALLGITREGLRKKLIRLG